MKSIGTDSLKVIIYFIKFLGSDTNLWEIHKKNRSSLFWTRDSMDIDKCVEKEGL